MTAAPAQPLYTYCRVCGEHWGTLSLLERHKPDCLLLNPATGFAKPEAPGKVPLVKPPTHLVLHAARVVRDVVPAHWVTTSDLWKFTDLKWSRFRAGLGHAEEQGWVVRRYPRHYGGKAWFRRPSEAALKGGQ